MKSIKLILSTFFIFFVFNVNAQKIKLKKNSVLVDEKEWLKYEGCRDFDSTCSIFNLADEEIIFIKFVKQSLGNSLFNRYGKPNYKEVSFLGKDKKIEIREFDKNILKILYKSKCVNEDGTLDMDKVNLLVEKYGTPFSDRLNESNNIIIIKEESNSKSSGSGVNIKIGN